MLDPLMDPGDGVRLVVDADTHFQCAPATWVEHVEPCFRGQVIAYDRGVGTPPGTMADAIAVERAHRIPSDDPVARLTWMDAEAIDACVIYPSTASAPLSCVDDADAAAASRGLRRWAAQFADHAPERFKPCMVLPWDFPERALEEFHAAFELGLEIAYVMPTPSAERRWSDPALDPVWAAMERVGVVVAMHEFTRFADGSQPLIARPTYTYPMRYLCGHTVELQLSVMDLILGGVFSRFPGLRFGFAEGHVAWLPGWLDMLDTAWERPILRDQHDPSMADDVFPSQLFRRQGFVVAFPEDRGIDEVVRRVGAHAVMLCTDYPHVNASYGLLERCQASCAGMPDGVKDRLLGANAAAVFKLGNRSAGDS
jgi:predicted TIM-barrel fold metal-dependent hydrolase